MIYHGSTGAQHKIFLLLSFATFRTLVDVGTEIFFCDIENDLAYRVEVVVDDRW